MSIELKKTERGFSLGEFQDTYGSRCSIQKSSNAEINCIWLGNNKGVRMHLDADLALELAEYLIRFARTGELK